MTMTDPRVRYAFDRLAELRGAFLDVLADVAPDLLADLWRDRDVAAWAKRHSFVDAWLVDAARDTLHFSAEYRGGTCPQTFVIDLPTEGGWTRDVNSVGDVRPGRPMMPAPREPGGLTPFLTRWRQYRHRLAAWSGRPVSTRWHAKPDHLRWCALRLMGASWPAIMARESLGDDDRLVRRRVRALACKLGLTLP